ncbi:MAG: TetR/AcrR family transcriptional regulator [Acidimicrobiales bacterium]
MSTREIARRPSYGPTSPVVGERGAQTRHAIVEGALALFAEQGFHATTVDDIADAVGVSRATLYQYFESKEQLFTELLNESGAAMMRVVRRLGPLGPTAAGYDNLHWWIGEWSWVYDKYSTMYVQWANVDSPRAPLRPMIHDFVERYVAAMQARITEAGVEGLAPEAAAVALLVALNRTSYFRHTTAVRGYSDAEVIDTLATVAQLFLFPATPPSAIRARVDGDLVPRPQTQGTGRRSAAGAERRDGRAEGADMSDRVQATVRRLLDGGARVFAARGYQPASVEDILTEAGFGRGTFYKYFRDKLDLLITLAGEAAVVLTEMAASFAEIHPGRNGAEAALRTWMTEFVDFHRHYTGVIRVWLELDPRDATLDAMRESVGAAVLRAFDAVLGRVERDYPFCVPAGSMILLALLERLPDQVRGTTYDMAAGDLGDLLAALVERGLFRGRPVTAR